MKLGDIIFLMSMVLASIGCAIYDMIMSLLGNGKMDKLRQDRMLHKK